MEINVETIPPETQMNTSTDSAEPALRTRLVTWREPVVDLAQIAAMSGLDYLQHLLDSGRVPPIAALLDFRLVRIEQGRAVFSGTPSEFHYNPIGAVHGGFAATLLDSALGCSIHTTLKARHIWERYLVCVNGELQEWVIIGVGQAGLGP